MEDSKYEFRCPMFLDFNSPEEDQEGELLAFFEAHSEMDKGVEKRLFNSKTSTKKGKKKKVKQEQESTCDAVKHEEDNQEYLTPPTCPHMKENVLPADTQRCETVTVEIPQNDFSNSKDDKENEIVVNLEVPPNLSAVLSITNNSQKKKSNKMQRRIFNKRFSGSSNLKSKSSNQKKPKSIHKYPLRWTPARLKKSLLPETETSNTPAKKKARMSETQERKRQPRPVSPMKENTVTRVKRSLSARTRSTNSSRSSAIQKRASSFNADSTVVPKVSKLVASSTPSCVRRALNKLRGKSKFTHSTEELELKKINEMRKQLAVNRKKYEEFHKKALQVPKMVDQSAFVASKSQPHCTVVEPFKFITDQRLKNQASGDVQVKERDFVSSLRRRSPNQHQEKQKEKVTKPIPFKFMTNRKRDQNGEPREQYCSLAQQIKAFHSQTPERFHRICPRMKFKSEAQTKPLLRTTIPHTPKLQCVARHRPVTAISQAQKEELEEEEMKKYKFKARPVNSKLFTQPVSGVSKVETKKSTKPEGFQLQTEARYYLREKNRPHIEEPKYEFHAQPLPRKILEGTVGLKEREEFQLTLPKSPAFALKGRSQLWKKGEDTTHEEGSQSLSMLRSNPVPHIGIPFRPKLQKKITLAEPFSFETRDKERWARKEEKIKEELEKEKKIREFKAQPFPSSSTSHFQPITKKVITKPEPFSLLIDQRGEERAARWQKRMEEELKRQRELAMFKARPAEVLHREPFVPVKAEKAPIECEEINLHTEQRAEEREKFEVWKHQRETELAAKLQKKREQEEKEEKKAIARTRAEAVHKAQPVRQFNTVIIRPSERGLTNPKSPVFATKLRARNNTSILH
ncbi:targeting protein for Xklp2-like [Limulus polyphemus]|uniref:Targeting protein for Xklp2-like n=1 Tax=Limulus polyphemus TaxID=6850 RepID=A0ABM1SBF5_LIMPO|nr:targeting protein for Xklp2-like [Limulus polyphemus]